MLEGSDNGVWNKVSHWVDYIEDTVSQLGETVCFGKESKNKRIKYEPGNRSNHINKAEGGDKYEAGNLICDCSL